MRTGSKQISVSVLPLMDMSHWGMSGVCLHAARTYANVLASIWLCVPSNLRSQEASGPFANVIEFMDQHTVRPALSGNLFDRIELSSVGKTSCLPMGVWLLWRDVICNDPCGWTPAKTCSSHRQQPQSWLTYPSIRSLLKLSAKEKLKLVH